MRLAPDAEPILDARVVITRRNSRGEPGIWEARAVDRAGVLLAAMPRVATSSVAKGTATILGEAGEAWTAKRYGDCGCGGD